LHPQLCLYSHSYSSYVIMTTRINTW